ncbi:MAG: LysR family transcriptional regulator [Methylovulum sp.]|nr:LysR family transcriptional regulator [Methylovulum sp.]
MNIRNIDLNLLHVFVTVYKFKSITLAAEELHLSQPAVSNAIKRLNSVLKTTLFIKNSRYIEPTHQADALYVDVKCCLDRIESAIAEQSDFDPEISDRTFHIATTNYGEILFFTVLIPYLQRHAPNIKIIKAPLTDDFSQSLRNGQIDCCLFYDHAIDNGIQKEFLCSDPLVLVTGLQHASLPDELTFDDMAELDFISFNNEYDDFNLVFSSFKHTAHFPVPRFRVATMWTAFFIVSTSELVLVTPLLYAKLLEKHLPIKIHTLTNVENIEMNLYWGDSMAQDAGHQWFRALIKELFLTDKNQLRKKN